MKLIKLKYPVLILLLSSLLFVQPGRGTNVTVDENVLKAAFVFRFMQFTTWPEPLGKEFKLYLVGNGEVPEILEKYSGRSLRGSTFTTVKASDLLINKDEFHAVFISTKDRAVFRNTVKSFGDKPILIISDMPGAFEENTDIALTTEPDGVTFSINLTQAKLRMFSFSSQMLKLAQRVK